MKRILLAVDGSDESERAAAMAGRLSAALDVPVDVLHVVERRRLVPPALVEEFERVERVRLDTEDLLRAMGGTLVEQAAKLVAEAGGTTDEQWVVIGHPATQIVEMADQPPETVIVMGRRGLGSATGLVRGSVTTSVGHLTDRTLVTVA